MHQDTYNCSGPYKRDAGGIRGGDVIWEVEIREICFEDEGRTQKPRNTDGFWKQTNKKLKNLEQII